MWPERTVNSGAVAWRSVGRSANTKSGEGEGAKEDAPTEPLRMVMASKMTPQSSVVGGREPELAQTSVPVVRARVGQPRAHPHAHPRSSQLTPQTSVGSRAARSRRVGLAQEKVSTATVFPPTETKEEPTCSGFSHSLRAAKAGVSLAGKREEREGTRTGDEGRGADGDGEGDKGGAGELHSAVAVAVGGKTSRRMSLEDGCQARRAYMRPTPGPGAQRTGRQRQRDRQHRGRTHSADTGAAGGEGLDTESERGRWASSVDRE